MSTTISSHAREIYEQARNGRPPTQADLDALPDDLAAEVNQAATRIAAFAASGDQQGARVEATAASTDLGDLIAWLRWPASMPLRPASPAAGKDPGRDIRSVIADIPRN